MHLARGEVLQTYAQKRQTSDPFLQNKPQLRQKISSNLHQFSCWVKSKSSKRKEGEALWCLQAPSLHRLFYSLPASSLPETQFPWGQYNPLGNGKGSWVNIVLWLLWQCWDTLYIAVAVLDYHPQRGNVRVFVPHGGSWPIYSDHFQVTLLNSCRCWRIWGSWWIATISWKLIAMVQRRSPPALSSSGTNSPDPTISYHSIIH